MTRLNGPITVVGVVHRDDILYTLTNGYILYYKWLFVL